MKQARKTVYLDLGWKKTELGNFWFFCSSGKVHSCLFLGYQGKILFSDC